MFYYSLNNEQGIKKLLQQFVPQLLETIQLKNNKWQNKV